MSSSMSTSNMRTRSGHSGSGAIQERFRLQRLKKEQEEQALKEQQRDKLHANDQAIFEEQRLKQKAKKESDEIEEKKELEQDAIKARSERIQDRINQENEETIILYNNQRQEDDNSKIDSIEFKTFSDSLDTKRKNIRKGKLSKQRTRTILPNGDIYDNDDYAFVALPTVAPRRSERIIASKVKENDVTVAEFEKLDAPIDAKIPTPTPRRSAPRRTTTSHATEKDVTKAESKSNSAFNAAQKKMNDAMKGLQKMRSKMIANVNKLSAVPTTNSDTASEIVDAMTQITNRRPHINGDDESDNEDESDVDFDEKKMPSLETHPNAKAQTSASSSSVQRKDDNDGWDDGDVASKTTAPIVVKDVGKIPSPNALNKDKLGEFENKFAKVMQSRSSDAVAPIIPLADVIRIKEEIKTEPSVAVPLDTTGILVGAGAPPAPSMTSLFDMVKSVASVSYQIGKSGLQTAAIVVKEIAKRVPTHMFTTTKPVALFTPKPQDIDKIVHRFIDESVNPMLTILSKSRFRNIPLDLKKDYITEFNSLHYRFEVLCNDIFQRGYNKPTQSVQYLALLTS